ncbi:MAG TPA: hypothetical protein VMB50_04150 [Myxococcales bacterium]|nr:hypothetical protein [Myxococcales bacterium]
MGSPAAVLAALILGQAAAKPSLGRAVAYFNDFDDAHCQAELTALLRHPQPRLVAAKAHLYLALIAMNRADPDGALAEFKKALLIDPAIDVGLEASPKARLAFQEARHELEGQLAGSDVGVARNPPGPTEGAPAAAVSEAAPSPRHGRSHALGITLVSIGAAAAAVAIYGGVALLQYDSYVNGVNAKPGQTAYGAGTPSASTANGWAIAWIPLAVAGALGIAGGVIAW